MSINQQLVTSKKFALLRYHWTLKLLVVTWKSKVWEQNCVWVFHYFDFEGNYMNFWSPCFLLNKNINININETGSKTRHTLLERRSLRFSSYENGELRLKLLRSGAHEKKVHLLYYWFCPNEHLRFILTYSVLNKPSEYAYFNISKKITS